MAQPPLRLDLDDAMNFILRFLKDPAVRRHAATYGDPGYDVWVNVVARTYLVHTVPDVQLEQEYGRRNAEVSVFLEAGWQLCRRGILRPGVRDLHQPGNAQGHAGQGFSLTEYGRAWIASANPELIPTQPGRFTQLLAKASRRFGSGFSERSQEAAAAYHRRARTVLSCRVRGGTQAWSKHTARYRSRIDAPKRTREIHPSSARNQ